MFPIRSTSAILARDCNDTAEELAPQYLEDAQFIKLYFPEGEVDFVVSGPLTDSSFIVEDIMGRSVRVETPIEIVAKKLCYWSGYFTARDILDFALMVEKEPEEMPEIQHIIRDQRKTILERILSADVILRKTFAELEIFDYRRTCDECVEIVTEALSKADGSATSLAINTNV